MRGDAGADAVERITLRPVGRGFHDVDEIAVRPVIELAGAQLAHADHCETAPVGSVHLRAADGEGGVQSRVGSVRQRQADARLNLHGIVIRHVEGADCRDLAPVMAAHGVDGVGEGKRRHRRGRVGAGADAFEQIVAPCGARP